LILVYAVLAGLIVGLLRAWLYKRPFNVPEIRLVWLAALAFFPQWLIFFRSPIRTAVDDQVAALILIGSLVLLFIFAWANRQHRAFWWLGFGLLLNMLVITANGGLMPISPETVELLNLSAPPEGWRLGQRLGSSKDILLLEENTHFRWLSDRFVTPAWWPAQAAFSLGDMFIAIGAFWLLCSAAGLSAHNLTGHQSPSYTSTR
jgi:hypothetical protein